MPTNLTGSTIASTFDQLLHVDDGPTATEKTVYSGTGVATALKIGTNSVSVENVQLDGNTISTLNTNGNLILAPNGTGSVAIGRAAITGGTISGITDLAVADGGTGASTAGDARTNLGLGTIATQNANNVAITGGAVSGVTFTGSTVGLGLLLVGRGRDLGDTLADPTVGIEDYSTKERDAFGVAYLLEREYADRASVQIALPPAQVDAVRRTLAAYRATPALYDFNNADASERWDSLVIFGTYENFEVSLAYPGIAYCSLTVQSLI